jgi:hypothetical protein
MNYLPKIKKIAVVENESDLTAHFGGDVLLSKGKRCLTISADKSTASIPLINGLESVNEDLVILLCEKIISAMGAINVEDQTR